MEITKNYWRDRVDPETGKRYLPRALTLHITDGSYGSTMNWIKNPRSQVSYNYVVHDRGYVEVVHPRHAAWANGHVVRPTWKGLLVEDNEIVNPNLYTISVAVVNKGGVPKWSTWVHWVRLCKKLLKENNWDIDPMNVVNHYEIKSSKRCPRPYLTRFYLKILTGIIK